MRGPWYSLWWTPCLQSLAWGHWRPLNPQKRSHCPYRSPLWPHPSQCSWHSLLPQWAPPLLLSLRGAGVPHEPPLAMDLSVSRPLLPESLGVVLLAGQSLTPLLVMWALTWFFGPLTLHLPTGIKPSSPWNFDFEVSTWNLEKWEECAQWQQLAWRGVTPPSTQGINLGAVPF